MPKQLPAAAAQLIGQLRLKMSAEGVYIKQIYAGGGDARPAVTIAAALAADGAPSRLHRLDCDETWLFCAGYPLPVYLWERGVFKQKLLGPDPDKGQRSSVTIPRGAIFGALPAAGEWCLFHCACVPGFAEAGCEFIPTGHPALPGGQAELIAALTAT